MLAELFIVLMIIGLLLFGILMILAGVSLIIGVGIGTYRGLKEVWRQRNID